MTDSAQQQHLQQPHQQILQKTNCSKCGLLVDGQFVRALNGCFHLDCFTCLDCGKVVATRFFPLQDPETGQKTPLCERDYFKRMDLLCANCGEALRGSYVTAVRKKYHLEHFTCSQCPTVFGPNETYYEHDGNVYCFYHYSIKHASVCGGCRMPILKQFVEVKTGSANEQWHPECYMIFKSWNIRLSSSSDASIQTMRADELKIAQQVMDEKSNRIWTVLSAFEESAAACISDMLLHVSNQGYIDAVSEAGNFIMHVEALFLGIDNLETEMQLKKDSLGLNFTREPKLLAKKIVNFFSVLSNSQESGGGGMRQNGVITQELLSLVTSLAQYLKILIRIALAGALKLERKWKHETSIGDLLNRLVELGEKQVDDENLRFDQRYKLADTEVKSDVCVSCKQSVEDVCIRFGSLRWHKRCFRCHVTQIDLSSNLENARFDPQDHQIYSADKAPIGSKTGFESVSQLEQYIFLLRVALKRLYSLLKVKDDSTSVSYSMLQSTTSLKDLQPSISTEDAIFTSPKATKPSTSANEHQQPQTENATNNNNTNNNNNNNSLDEITKKVVVQAEMQQSIHNLVETVGIDIPSKPDDKNNRLSTSLPEASENNAISRANRETEEKWQVSGGQPKMIAQRSAKGKAQCLAEIGALETFVVSHLAVLRLHPLVQDNFTMNELLDMVRSRKATFWTKILASLKPGKKPGKTKESGTFGVPLEVLVEKYGTETKHGNGIGRVRIPLIVDAAITKMLQMNMKTEGIFRKNGNIKNLCILQDALDNDPSKVNLDKENVIQLAALLKKFLRDLPEPLLTFRLYKLFIQSQKSLNLEVKKKILHYCCCLLPKANRDLLEVLLIFLREVASFAQGEGGNKMDVSNLATVIAPNILYQKPKDSTKPDFTVKDESFLAIDAVKMLLQFQDEFWMIPADIADIMQDNEFLAVTDLPAKDVIKKYETVLNMKKSNTYHDFRSDESPNATASPAEDVSSPIMKRPSEQQQNN